MNRKLRIYQVAVIILFIVAGVFFSAYRNTERQLQFVKQNASWLYPYIPRLDDDIAFTVEFFGNQFSGTYSEDFEILFVGASEKPDLFFARDFLQSLPNEERVVLDIGASKGQHSLFYSGFSNHIHAFEPFPPAIAHFKKHVQDNNISNITLHEIGLGAEESSLTFYVDEASPYTGTFVEGLSENHKALKEMPIRTGDDVLAELRLPSVALIKIDIEGFEKPALQGLRRTMESSRPVVIMELLAGFKSDVGFRSIDELAKTFPKNYKFLQFDSYDVYGGDYQLAPLNMKQQLESKSAPMMIGARNIIAYPGEKEVPLHGPVEKISPNKGRNPESS